MRKMRGCVCLCLFVPYSPQVTILNYTTNSMSLGIFLNTRGPQGLKSDLRVAVSAISVVSSPWPLSLRRSPQLLAGGPHTQTLGESSLFPSCHPHPVPAQWLSLKNAKTNCMNEEVSQCCTGAACLEKGMPEVLQEQQDAWLPWQHTTLSVPHLSIPSPLHQGIMSLMVSARTQTRRSELVLLLLLLSHFSRVRLCATPQTGAHQAPPSLGFSRQEYWSGVPLPSPLVLLDASFIYQRVLIVRYFKLHLTEEEMGVQKGKELAQDHTTNKRQGHDQNPGLLHLKAFILCTLSPHSFQHQI